MRQLARAQWLRDHPPAPPPPPAPLVYPKAQKKAEPEPQPEPKRCEYGHIMRGDKKYCEECAKWWQDEQKKFFSYMPNGQETPNDGRE